MSLSDLSAIGSLISSFAVLISLIYLGLQVRPQSAGVDPAGAWRTRAVDIILAVGRDDSLCPANEAFSQTLWSKGIGNALRVWDGWAHDWPYWQQMVQLYIGGERS